MNPRTDLAFFSTLIKSGSLTAAAREFDVTPSAVSKWLAQLEARLGVRLVARSTRRISLTNEGETYLAEGRRILAEIDDLERTIAKSGAMPVGLLRVNATLGFGRSFIAPAVSDFAAHYPELEIQLLLTSRPLSLAQGEADVRIRFGEPPDARVHARKIADHRRRVVAAPSYLERHGRPLVPHDLVRHNCLIVRQDDVAYGQWHFTKGRKTETVKVRGTLSSNDGSTALLWAAQGHGILMRSEWDTAPLVRSGELEVLFDDYTLPSADIYATYPQRQNLAAKVRVFVDFLTARFARAAGRGGVRW
jgi:LysR family transcriptional regulator, transcriptional activator for dmlA